MVKLFHTKLKRRNDSDYIRFYLRLSDFRYGNSFIGNCNLSLG